MFKKIFSREKITEYFFYALVFFLPWQTIWLAREVWVGGAKWEYGTIGVYFSQVVLIVLLALFFWSHQRDFFSYWPKSFLFWSGTFFIAWNFFSIIWAPDKLLAFYFFLKLLLTAGLFILTRRISFSWEKLLIVFLLAASLQGVLAIGQFLTQKDFSSLILGTSSHLAEMGGSSVVETESGRWLRAYGIFSHPNILGGYLAAVLIFIGMNGKIFSRVKFGKTLIYVSAVFIFSGLLVSFSRAAWLSVVIGWALVFIFNKNKKYGRQLLKISFIFLMLVLIWISAFPSLFLTRTTATARLEKKSLFERKEYTAMAREIIKENLFFGVGAGNYTLAARQLNNDLYSVWSYQPVHNGIYLITSELGIIGLFFFIIWVFFLFRQTWLDSYPLWAVFSFFFLADHWLWTSWFGLALFFLFAGLARRKEK